ncbi:lipopolysaccharide biosynthesis protein [Ruminococcus sp.]
MSKKSRERTPELEEIAAQLGSMNAQEEDDTITIPVVEIFRQLKKYFLPWVLVAVIFAGLVFGGSMVVSSSKASPLTAMVGFTFDGIENGLDPNGNEFNANSLKSPAIIEETLSDLNMDVKKTDAIRNNITVSGVVPEDAIDKLTAYESVFSNTNSIEAAQKIMDVSYFPTQFEVQFSYGASGMSRSQAADFLNTMLNNYKIYFMQTYGYNQAFGDALTAVDYTGYDYPQALDILSSSLDSLKKYISSLSSNDNTRFRSTKTGYTFSDLSEATATLQSVDYSSLYSYIMGKNVTKDKDSLATYYQYRIDSLNRSLNSAKERLSTITDSINNYKKDSMVVMAGGSADNTGTVLTQPSTAYDDLITQRTDAQSNVSSLQQQISDYQTRLDKLQNTPLGSKKEEEKVETDMKNVCDKMNQLINDVNETADDYFETASYTNAYNILVPASGSVSSSVSNAISNMMRPMLIVEALLFVAYLVFAVVRAFMVSYRREKLVPAAVEEPAKETVSVEAESASDDNDEKEEPKA